jgi:hypothetical protein
MILFTLLVGGGLSGSVLASGGGRIDPADLQAITPEDLILKESADGSAWTPIIGDLGDGYSMVLDPAKDYLVDIETLEADPALADGWYGIDFDAFRAPDGFFEYWAGEGVDEVMGQIINGELPMFYIKASGGIYSLVDGYLYATNAVPGSVTTPWQINGDLPVGTYHFGGQVDTEYLNIQITFTKQATVSITPDTSTVDNACGFVDVTIHIADVHDLYALDIALAFDPAFLEVVDMDAERAGVNLHPITDWFNPEYLVYNDANNNTGVIRYAATQLRPTDPIEPLYGEGDVATIRFQAKSPGIHDVTIASAELSDRDGFLIGREVILELGTITANFTTPVVPALDIIRLDASTVELSWPVVGTDLVTNYHLYRSTIPYFYPEGTAYQVIPNDGIGPVTFDDIVLGNVVDNYFYAVRAECTTPGETQSAASDQVGKFEYELHETAKTDFTWVGLVLETTPAISTASELLNHINGNTNNDQVVIDTISEWNPEAQGYSTYNPSSIPPFDFDVNVKYPYRVGINIPDTATGSVIWAQVGKLPQITTDTYQLWQTAKTDFSWILQPLDMVDVSLASELSAQIEHLALPQIDVLSVANWNPGAQQLDTFDFVTRFGYPYRIGISVSDGNTAIWP